ncbi:MAG: hypothetical protein ACTSUV_05250 [Candidatus Ranarchaeia archaeon]
MDLMNLLFMMLQSSGQVGEFSIDQIINNIQVITAGCGFLAIFVVYGNIKKILELFPGAKMNKSWKNIGILSIVFQICFMVLFIPKILAFFGIVLAFPVERWILPFVYVLMSVTIGGIVSISHRTYKIILDATRD